MKTKVKQVVITKPPNGGYLVWLMKDEISEDFEFCSVCEEENGNEIVDCIEVERVRLEFR